MARTPTREQGAAPTPAPAVTASNLSVAIVHHPCLNKNGAEICATVSEYDVFDASRLSLAYPLRHLYIINHEPAQRDLVARLLKHGTDSRPDARGVFSKTVWAPDLTTIRSAIDASSPPIVVATSARSSPSNVSFSYVRKLMHQQHVILLVGKAWGLAQSVIDEADFLLEPIDAGTGYNHLSVRSALAILIDRLCCGSIEDH